jgi:hypothetical protein
MVISLKLNLGFVQENIAIRGTLEPIRLSARSRCSQPWSSEIVSGVRSGLRRADFWPVTLHSLVVVERHGFVIAVVTLSELGIRRGPRHLCSCDELARSRPVGSSSCSSPRGGVSNIYAILRIKKQHFAYLLQEVVAIRGLGAALGRRRGERWEELDNDPATAPRATMDGRRAERGESVMS